MNKGEIIVIFLLFLVFLLSIFLIFILLIRKYNKRVNQLRLEVKQKTNLQRQFAIEIVLKRVARLSRDNKQFSQIKHKLSATYDAFVKQFNKLQSFSKQLETKIKKTRFSFRQFLSIHKKFMKKDLFLTKIEKNFNNLARNVIAQDEILREEFYFYQKRLREIFNLYHERQMLFSLIENKIDNFSQSITYIEKQFETIIDQGDTLQAEILIQRYIHKVFTLARIVNYGPFLATQISVKIPQEIEQLKNLYDEIHAIKNKPKNINPLAFQSTLKAIKKPFKRAQKAFQNLDVTRTIKEIKLSLLGIASSRDQIRLEVKAKTTFKIVQLAVSNEAKKFIKEWQQVNHQFEEIASFGKIISLDLFDSYNDSKTIFITLEEQFLKYNNIIGSETSYVTKLQQATFLLETLKRALTITNHFIANMKKLDLEKANMKAKLLHAEAIFTTIISAAKKKSIVLNVNDQVKIKNIKIQKALLWQQLKNDNNLQTKTRIEQLLTQIANLYNLIAGKMQMAFHIENMIQKCAPQRATNPNLDIGLREAENKFLEGDYATSLNEIINCIRDENLYA